MLLSQQVLSIFFAACSVVCILHVFAIIRDKSLSGASTIPCWVFMSTNLYEVFYFGDLGQWYAAAGALLMFALNGLWMGLVWWYRWMDLLDRKVAFSLDFKGYPN